MNFIKDWYLCSITKERTLEERKVQFGSSNNGHRIVEMSYMVCYFAVKMSCQNGMCISSKIGIYTLAPKKGHWKREESSLTHQIMATALWTFLTWCVTLLVKMACEFHQRLVFML